jgi:hypothetical protein
MHSLTIGKYGTPEAFRERATPEEKELVRQLQIMLQKG